MKNSILTSGSVTLVALGLIVALAGCAPAVHPGSKTGNGNPASNGSAAASATPSATPTAAGLGPLPANALFRITATVTEPGGAKADLVETVFAPAAPTASDTALLNAQCNFPGDPGWAANYANPLYVTATITATLHPGTHAWSADDGVAAYFSGSAAAFSGDYHVAQADCADGNISIPGTIHGVVPVDASNPSTGTYGWAGPMAGYGFDGGGNFPGDANSGGTGVVKDCVIEESAAATAASPVVEGWLTQPFDIQSGCRFIGPSPA